MKRGVLSVFCLLVVLVSGCSTIEYTAEKEPMINFKPVENASNSFEYTESQKFFVFGMTPQSKEINVTEIAAANGAVNGLAEVEIEESYTAMDILWTTLTCGLYCPRTVKITGKIIDGPDVENEEVKNEKL